MQALGETGGRGQPGGGRMKLVHQQRCRPTSQACRHVQTRGHSQVPSAKGTANEAAAASRAAWLMARPVLQKLGASCRHISRQQRCIVRVAAQRESVVLCRIKIGYLILLAPTAT